MSDACFPPHLLHHDPQQQYQLQNHSQHRPQAFPPPLQALQPVASMPSPSAIATSESTDSLRGTIQKHEQMEWEQYSAEKKPEGLNISRINSSASSNNNRSCGGDEDELSGICRNGSSRLGSEEPSPTSAAWSTRLSPSSQGSCDSSSQISGVWEKRFSKKGFSDKLRPPPSISFEHLSPAIQQQPASRLPLTSESVWEDSEDEDEGYNKSNKSSSAGRRRVPKWYCLLCCVSSRVVPRNERSPVNNNKNKNKNDQVSSNNGSNNNNNSNSNRNNNNDNNVQQVRHLGEAITPTSRSQREI